MRPMRSSFSILSLHTLTTLLVPLSLAITACNASPGAPEGNVLGAPSALRHEEIVRYLAGEHEQMCEVHMNCCSEAERQWAFRLPTLSIMLPPSVTTKEGCVESLAELIPLDIVATFIEASLDAGRTTWDATKVETCLDEWSNCAVPGDLQNGTFSERCTVRPLRPATPLGGACTFAFECAEGACVEAKCTALPVAGEACAAMSEGGPLQACANGLTCRLDTKICSTPAAIDARCSQNGDCASGECHFSTAGADAAGRCATPTLCNGDVGDDLDVVLGECSNNFPPAIPIACVLGTADEWQCTCTPASGPSSTCTSPFGVESKGDPCGAASCCTH